jgi:glycosyltransferase involved in cell wall biosynthesis
VKGTSVSPVLPAEKVAERAQTRGKRVGILVVTYNAVTTLARVLRRIPEPVWQNVEEILVFDDASQDATYELAVGLQTLSGDQKLHVLKHPKNLGYGGNQKAGYRYFIEKGFDAVVLLHGDGQYAPEVLAEMYAPLLGGEADAVFGSRMMPDYGGPLKGGMPLYKYVGNRVLTYFENRALGLKLTEWHSGYRAYRVEALRQIDFSQMTDDFHFDTEIIIKLHHQGFRIREVPIPTFYGDEICYVNGMRYARDILRSVYRYDQTRRSIRCYPEYREYFAACPVKHRAGSSHDLARRAVGTGQKVLEYTNGDPSFGAELAGAGNDVVSRVAADAGAGGLGALERAVRGGSFTRILMLDVLEHMAAPERILEEAREMLAPNGRLVASLPNVANITVRLRLLFGRFEYGDGGIPDRTHLRFYTRGTARRLVESAGFEIVECRATPMPVDGAIGSPRWAVRAAQRFFGAAARIWPSLFGYQTFLVARLRS